MKTLGTSAVTSWVLVYAVVWVICMTIDMQHCEANGAYYDSTEWDLTGYCRVSGVRIKAANLGVQ